MSQDVMQLIDEINWDALEHSFGSAHDLPALLRALMSSDADAQQAAHDLDTKVFHPEFLTTANAPVMRVVAMMLAENKAVPEVRQLLVEFLGLMAVTTKNAERDHYLPDLHRALGTAMQYSYPVVLKFFDAPELPMRKTAVEAATVYILTRSLAHHRPALVARLRTWARACMEERAYWVKQLTEMGEDTEEFLADENVHVRVAAALSPILKTNAVATGIIVEALVRAADDGAPGPLNLLPHEAYSLSQLIEVAVVRAEDLQSIVMPAVAIARRGDWTGFDSTWGALMRAIFSPPYSDGAKLSPLQREFLAALGENPQIWNYKLGNIYLLFKEVGLPFSRESCASICMDLGIP